MTEPNVQESNVGPIESYCGACEQWSLDDEWIDGDVVWGEESIEGYVECPRCGHHFPPYDPPMRNRP